MQLCAILTREDLASALDQITPLSVTLRRRRVIWLGRPSTVELVAGRGLRLRGDARFTWDVGGIAVPVNLRSWQVLLVPSFALRGARHVLALDPELESLDFKSVPVFLDTKITAAINDGLAAQKNRLAWDFGKSLSLVRSLPESVAPGGELRLGPRGGQVTVSEDDVRLTLDFELEIARATSASQAAADVISPCTRVNVAPKKMIWDDR
jgi:hypothetical protein